MLPVAERMTGGGGLGLRDKPKRVPGLKQDLNTGWEVRREAGVKPDYTRRLTLRVDTLHSAVR